MAVPRYGKRLHSTRWSGTARAAAAVLAVPALLLTSCGADDPKPDGEPLSADQQAELGSKIAAAMAEAESTRMDVAVDIAMESDSESAQMTMTGDGIAETTETPAAQIDLSLDLTGSATESFGPIEMLTDGAQYFMHSADATDLEAFTGSAAYAEPNQWIKLGATEAETIASSTTSYTEYAELIETVASADGGTDELGHRYNLAMTMQQLVDSGIETTALGQQSLDTLPADDREAILDSPVTVSMWLDSENRIVQQTIEMSMDVAEVTVDMEATIGFSDFGVPVQLDLPRDYATV
jgi:hypothetical protein